MVNVSALAQITVAAFREKAVSSVVLIDEQFPNLREALNAINVGDSDELLDQYREHETAQALYEEFHRQHCLCDVANTPLDWQERLSTRISESDLVVLDLHLRGGDDSTDSIELLQSLADTPKLNLVIVYTRDEDLTSVAYRLAGSIRGQCTADTSDEFISELPEVINQLASYDCPQDEVVKAFLYDRKPTGIKYQRFQSQVMKNHAQMRGDKCALSQKLADHILRKDYRAIADDTKRVLIAANFDSENPWMVFENLFVVVASKKSTPPSNVLSVLDNALIDWNPGIVRTVIAQIQNTMSRRGYAFSESLSSDLHTQVGWLWHAKCREGGTDEKGAVKILLNRMLLGLRRSLLSDQELSTVTTDWLKTIPTCEGMNDQISEITEWCGGGGGDEEITPTSVFHALNAYQSSAPFEGKYITTGTIMFSHDSTGNRWWVCVEPACSTVPNQAPAAAEYIQCQLLELKKETDNPERIVFHASKSKHLFVMFNRNREFLSVVNDFDQPMLRSAYIPKHGEIKPSGKYHEATVLFPSLNDAEPKLFARQMQIVAQLHEPYANRLLHLSGHHLSRIGLDFVDRPQEVNSASECAE